MQQHNMSWIEVCSPSESCASLSSSSVITMMKTVIEGDLYFSFQVQFLRKAVDVLCLCRNTLKYTYVFAFYLKKNNQSVIFEVTVTSIFCPFCFFLSFS